MTAADDMTAAEQLEALAQKRAATTGESFEKAYAEILNTPEGVALYDQKRDERRPDAIFKRDIRQRVTEQIEEEAVEAFPDAPTTEQAVTKFLHTDDGREMYEAYRDIPA